MVYKEGQLSRSTVVGILVFTLMVSLATTYLTLNKISNAVRPMPVTISGFATSDTGRARIHIEDLLAIDVDNNSNLINFGECTPTSITNSNVSISSEMNETEINATGMSCSNSTLPSFIKILNVGNVEANVSVYSNKLGPDLLVSSRGEIYYRTVNGTTNGGCALANTQPDYLEISGIGPGNRTNACNNLTPGSLTNSVNFYVNLTVPNDAETPEIAEGNLVTFTFEAFVLN